MTAGEVDAILLRSTTHRWRIVFNYGCQNTHRGWRTPITSKMDTHSKPQTPIAPISVSWRENAFFFYGTSVCKQWRVVGTYHTTCLVSVLISNLQSTFGVTIILARARAIHTHATQSSASASLVRVSGNVTSDRRSQRASYCRSQRASDHRP